METIEQRKARRKAAAKERRQELKKLLTAYKTASAERVAEVEQAAGLACGFSPHNRVLLGLQAFARGMVLGKVQAASKWSEQGRKVRKGQHALQVLAPIFPRAEVGNEVDGGTEVIVDESGKPSWFKAVPVFDISQTEPMTEQDRARAAKKTERTAPAPVQREPVKSAPEDTAGDRVRRELEDWHKFMARHGRSLKFRLEEDGGVYNYSILLDDMSIEDCAAEDDLESAVENALQILGCVKLAPEPPPSAPAPEPETAGDLFAWRPAFAAI